MKNIKSGTFKNTFCIFNEIDPATIKFETFDYISPSGSSYFYTKTGMYRFSNHWGRLANSKWRLISLVPETPSKFKYGFALWEDFYPDNDRECLYYLEVDYEAKTVTYQHKNNPNFDNKSILRTSFETSKKIKQIRNLFNLTSWSKHFIFDDLDVFRKEIIEKLIYTNLPLEEIKRALL